MIKSELVVRVGVGDMIDAAVRRMAAEAHRVRHVGIAVVLDEGGRVVGVVTDGDIRRAYAADIPFSEPVRRIMSPDPVSVPAGLPIEQVPAEVLRRIRQGGRLKADIVRHVLVTDANGGLVEIYDSLSLLAQSDQRRQSVAVYGLGREGLSLALALAAHGHSVTGIDSNAALVERLDARIPPAGQEAFAAAIATAIEARTLRFEVPGSASNSDNVHILALDASADGAADLVALGEAAKIVGRRLRANDLVMLRSRGPLGTGRGLVRKTLERVSGLNAGDDFALAVTPDYVRGRNSQSDIESAPQIVGGLTARCGTRAAGFWSALTPIVVPVDGVEAAELAALASGAFRDISIAFANELALIADRHNIDVHALAAAVQRGDPQLAPQFLRPAIAEEETARDVAQIGLSLRVSTRKTSELMAGYQAEIAARFARRRRIAVKDLKVVAVGPGHAASAADCPAALAQADVVLFDGNASLPPDLDLKSPLAAGGKRLIFDPQGRLDRTVIESTPGHVYATIGYMTPPKVAVIACDNGFGHARRCAAIAAALRERGATCDLFVPPELTSRLDAPTVPFRTQSNPEGWRNGAAETVCWPDRLPSLAEYDFVLADSLPEILNRRPDALLIGHFLWTHTLSDVDQAHAASVEALLERYRPRMLGTGLLATDRLKATTRYEDVGFFADAELEYLPARRDELLVSSGLGAEPEALAALREVVAALAAMTKAPAPFRIVHIEPGLLPDKAPQWMIPANYEPAMYRGLVAAILRPGAGTVTDCLSRGVWIVWPQSADHQEIEHNARALASHDVGAVAMSAHEAIEMVCAFANDPARRADMLARCHGLRFDGAARVAEALLDNIRSHDDAPTGRHAARAARA